MPEKFVPRVRKQKALARLKSNDTTQGSSADANALEIVPEGKDEREERRARLRAELRASQPQSKVSKQKAKRLDKYIDKKLKKEENLALIKKLERTKIDTSLFSSSRRLGQDDTKRQALQRALRERDAGLNTEENEELLFEEREDVHDDAPAVSVKSSKAKSKASASTDETEAPIVHIQPPSVDSSAPISVTTFGTGLKRPLELDESGMPVIQKRQRTKVPTKPTKVKAPVEQLTEPAWEGFDTEDSDQEEENVPEANGWDEISSASDEEDIEEDDEDSEDLESDETDSDEEDDDTSETSDDNVDEEVRAKERGVKKARMSAFKAWADNQRNEAVGFTPSNALEEPPPQLPAQLDYTPLPVEQDPLPAELSTVGRYRKAYAVAVQRTEEVSVARLALPVVAEEQRIMEAIFNHDVVVISGATGSGKTTQVPQFLFENGFGDPSGPTPGMIGVTQPRRVAAVSMANRVGDELASAKGKVAYQIRFDTTVSKQTAVKFMTDGVLLRELSQDLTLKKYSIIIIDEAHERTVNTDILISMLSRCVKGRSQLAKDKPKEYTVLKLVIMSATLRVSDFRENPRLFDIPPPLVTVEGRQYGVTPHWQRKTSHDFLEDAFQKIKRGHKRLPAGGMLVFLTGQNEVQTLMKRLKQSLPATEPLRESNVQVRLNAKEMPLESEDFEARLSKPTKAEERAQKEEDYDSDSDISISGLEDEEEAKEFDIEGEEAATELSKIHVLPLYSQLPSEEQLKVFQPPPENSRLIILATNVAETSITIPGIRYVIDSGRAKQRVWDTAGVESFQTTWVSKASADQRAGRAGRTGPGHVYRLYSSAVYESFNDFAEPEIRSAPLERVVLQLKAMKIPNLERFPFVTAPDQSSWLKASRLLGHLGALDAKGEITPLGHLLQTYPLNPRFGNMLRLGVEYDCAPLVIAAIAAMDAPELFIPANFLGPATATASSGQLDAASDDSDALDLDEEYRANQLKHKAHASAQAHLSRLDRTSDCIKLLTAVYDYSLSSNPFEYCTTNYIRLKAMREAQALRQQLTQIVSDQNPAKAFAYKKELGKPSEKQLGLLKQIVAAGFVDQVAIRADFLPNPPVVERKPKRAIDVRYQTLIPSTEYLSSGEEKPDPYVYIHPTSTLSNKPPKSLPNYIIYHRLQRSQQTRPGIPPKTRMHALTPVSGEQLAVLARGTSLLDVGKPVGRVLEREGGLRECEVLVSLRGEGGGVGWPLCRKRVVQRRVGGVGWVVERYLD